MKEVRNMPGFDKTGPYGLGSMSGKGFGPCGLGLGWRKRFGAGRGMGRYFTWNWPQNKEEQKNAIIEYKKALREEIEDVNKELIDLKKVK
jgi:hypothetical protein